MRRAPSYEGKVKGVGIKIAGFPIRDAGFLHPGIAFNRIEIQGTSFSSFSLSNLLPPKLTIMLSWSNRAEARFETNQVGTEEPEQEEQEEEEEGGGGGNFGSKRL
jgi:hypothetical protein